MVALTRWNESPVMSLRDAFNELFDSAFAPVLSNGTASYQSGPAANVWETADEYQMAIMMPGVDPDNVKLTTIGQTLTIEGALELSTPEGAKSVWQEFGPAQFRRQFTLPAEVDGDKIKAMYRNGILLLTVPKAEHAKPRSIKVQAA